MSNKEKTEVKISVPLINDKELENIDCFYNNIVDEYVKCFVKERDQVILQRVMMNLRDENKKLKKKLKKRKEIIDKAIEYINGAYEMATYTKSVSLDEENIEDLLDSLSKSKFRGSFHLNKKMKDYVKEKGMDKIKLDAKELITKRIAPEIPKNDGKQTPMRQVHPVFIAQHATRMLLQRMLRKNTWDKKRA